MGILGHLTRESKPDQVAQAIVEEAIRRRYPRDEAIAVLSTAIQESGLRPKAVSPNGSWHGIYQQDASYLGRDDPNDNIREFFNRLDQKRRGPGASSDPWVNVFWLQQRPGERTAQQAYDNGRKPYMTEIKSRIAEATDYYDRFSGGSVPTGGVSGDPIWLEDVLRPALGDRLKTMDGWQDSGVGGTMGRIWGVIWHHTGNANASAQSIRDGRPDLAGPLSQLHIAPSGIVTIVAVGPCNHAGSGSWEGLPTDGANDFTIGIECAWPKDTSLTEATEGRERWPDAQIISMRDVGAALTKHLDVPVSHNISHEEWARRGPAGARQHKWDPGNLSMEWFRGEIAKDIAGQFDNPPPPVVPPVPPVSLTDRRLLEDIWRQLHGPDGHGWPQLGTNDKGENLTPVDFLAKYKPALDKLLADVKAGK